MTLKSLVGATCFCIGTLCLNSANAAIINMTASLDEAQEVPSTGSAGTGFATVTLDDATLELSWDVQWQNLTGPATAMHFHGNALPGSNAPPIVDIGAISGLTSPSIGSATISSAMASDLLAGLWYINIHTSSFPGGEIRGQVEVVPIPAAVWLFGSGLVGLIAFARRKRS